MDDSHDEILDIVRAVAQTQRDMASAPPAWKKPGFWVSCLAILGTLGSVALFVLNLVLGQQFEEFSERKGKYSQEKRHNSDRGVIENSRTVDKLTGKVERNSEKLDSVLAILMKQKE